ncbi:PTS transporter subunit EIIB [Spiroplasma endosymbiont of Polydrusus formosus]|uniref:PTS transporter subunit EIIB n=1 Tax=Spiroplasma endosymbiont of Polydrusus formosus TaxID=3139326 RepID=UPI0035B5074E
MVLRNYIPKPILKQNKAEANQQYDLLQKADTVKREKARKIIEFLSGTDNIATVDSCALRLRVTFVNSSLVNKYEIKALGGSTGIFIPGQSIQIIYGCEQ